MIDIFSIGIFCLESLSEPLFMHARSARAC